MKSVNIVILLAIIASILAACGPSEMQIAKAIAETEAARPTETPIPPTPTPTQVPLSELDITDLLVQEGDLPAGFSTAQYRTIPSPDAEFPLPAIFTQIELDNNGKTGGWIRVLIYEDLEQARAAYDWTLPGISPDIKVTFVPGLGDDSFVAHAVLPMGLSLASVGYIHCSAVVEITIYGDNTSKWEYYAQALDQRLAVVVCPYMD